MRTLKSRSPRECMFPFPRDQVPSWLRRTAFGRPPRRRGRPSSHTPQHARPVAPPVLIRWRGRASHSTASRARPHTIFRSPRSSLRLPWVTSLPVGCQGPGVLAARSCHASSRGSPGPPPSTVRSTSIPSSPRSVSTTGPGLPSNPGLGPVLRSLPLTINPPGPFRTRRAHASRATAPGACEGLYHLCPTGRRPNHPFQTTGPRREPRPRHPWMHSRLLPTHPSHRPRGATPHDPSLR